jgi:hypothetical protein
MFNGFNMIEKQGRFSCFFPVKSILGEFGREIKRLRGIVVSLFLFGHFEVSFVYDSFHIRLCTPESKGLQKMFSKGGAVQ